MSETRALHWADAVAQDVLQHQSRHLLSTGITPSGEYHVGHLREILTAEGVYRALCDQGAEVRMHYIADTMDPLRRVYAFLDPTVYQNAVGKPLCDIPCPCGAHPSYAEHYLEPFLEAVHKLGVEMDVLRADELYRQGQL
ncbi:MAG TPA: lysine--tRNA ligase, partial [Candidatus Tectomicrobia bacterium]